MALAIPSVNRTDAPIGLVLQSAYPELAAARLIRELMLSDLEKRGLLGGLSGMVGEHAILDSMTSTLARQFLVYIGDQPEKEK